MSTKLRVPFLDQSNKSSTATFFVDPAITDADINAFLAELVKFTEGTRKTCTLTTEVPKSVVTAPVTPTNGAQREHKWLIRYSDNTTGSLHYAEIPTANTSLLAPNSDFVDLSAGDGALLKTEFEANMLSPAGNSVTLLSMQSVGRTLN